MTTGWFSAAQLHKTSFTSLVSSQLFYILRRLSYLLRLNISYTGCMSVIISATHISPDDKPSLKGA